MRILPILLVLSVGSPDLRTQEKNSDPTGDVLVREWFEARTRQIEARPTSGGAHQDRATLARMLGLDPMPDKTPLEPVVTGTIESEDDLVVEKLHFQASPGLYVGANFYRPARVAEGTRLPAVLYVCGHSRQQGPKGERFGNKAGYQHHGIWYARNGFCCLMIDTIQLGEFDGIHHGTYRHGRWWWNARGYTPAGVEAWNGIRAIDYLQTRPEVDPDHIGVAGRSGGGAYSWWIAALDERIKAAVPVAGIASIRNHVVDGCVEGHCDCMFMVNSAGWDFARVASLVAPRPLLILNTDQDRIFPADGVADVYQKTLRAYKEAKVPGKVSLRMTPGPHKDTAELQEAEYRFMLRHLRGIEEAEIVLAEKEFEPADLKVFAERPADEVVTRIDETFVPLAENPLPRGQEHWDQLTARWSQRLATEVFANEPSPQAEQVRLVPRLEPEAAEGVATRTWEVRRSGEGMGNQLHLFHRDGLTLADLELIVLNVVDSAKGYEDLRGDLLAAFPGRGGGELDRESFEASRRMFAGTKWGMAYLVPKGIGETAWTTDERKRTHIRRRFALLGTTLDAVHVADIEAAIHGLHTIEKLDLANRRLWMQSRGVMAGNVLYAAHRLGPGKVERLDLHALPATHAEGPIYLGVLRVLDLPAAVALVGRHTKIRLYDARPENWSYALEVSRILAWDEKQISVREPVE